MPGVGLEATKTLLVPGQTSSEAADGISRWVVASYTIQPSDIANFGSEGVLDSYKFGTPAGSTDGVTARIYVNGGLKLPSPLPPNFTFAFNYPGIPDTPGGFAPSLDTLHAGDVIAVAIGGGTTSTGDSLDVDYTISLTPEPGSLLLGFVGIGLLAQRRGR